METEQLECTCEFCKNKLPFDLPLEIVDAALNGDLVIFAGAGISTESKNVFKETLYEDILEELKLSEDAKLNFSTLMSEYCKLKNGRRKLLDRIRSRFEYCHQFKELYRLSTTFHQELSSMYLIDNVFTTNWDDYFERECNAIPIVTAEDFAFYNNSGRKVFKIHGSISNYGSIIATNEDYQKCYENLKNGLIGGYLKTVLATKVVVFIGFSFSDFDFSSIYNYLKAEMNEVLPHCYIVTLDEQFKSKFSTEKATVICTDGTYFIATLRKHLEGINCLLPKENLDVVYDLRHMIGEIHEESVAFYEKKRTTASIYNLFYQDGLQHAFDFLLYHSKSGLTFNPYRMIASIESYLKIKSEFLKAKNYPDYAYVEGNIYLGCILY